MKQARNLDHWKIFGRGYLDIIEGGADGTSYAFINTDRQTYSEGIKQELVVSCLTEGVRLEVNAYMKLSINGAPFTCDKTKRYGHPMVCPLMSIKFVVPTAPTGHRWLHITNQNPFDWVGDEFNLYRGEFVITSEMTTSTEAYLYIYGPRGDVDITMDQVSIVEYKPPQTECTQLIRDGDAEVIVSKCIIVYN